MPPTPGTRRGPSEVVAPLTPDVLVIGAGPAGSAAARLLAAWGHRVLVVDRLVGDAGRLAESIPPSADKLLAAIGALAAIADAGFLPWRGNTVWWAGEPPRAETFPPGVAGYQVVRRDFDRRLRDLAAESGAEIRDGRVREVRVPGVGAATDRGPAAGDGPTAIVDCGDALTPVAPRIVIDASGRAGMLARQGLRLHDVARRTVALAAVWRAPLHWPVPDDTHTLVASYEDGWAWSVPTAPGVRQFTVMVDPARTERPRGASSREVYLAELAKVAPFAPILAEGALEEGPWGADASLYSAERCAGPGFLLAGDAGSSIDPLSSFGVKKALASGWLAAIAAHTSLVTPAMQEHAMAFFNRRERAVLASARRQASVFAAEAAARTAHPFWIARVDAPTEADHDEEPDTAALARDPAVLAAFAGLRVRESLRLAVGPEVRIAPRPAVRGREIVLDEHVFLPVWPGGLRYLRGVDLVELLRLAPLHHDAGELYRALGVGHPQVALPDFLGALAVLLAEGALRHV